MTRLKWQIYGWNVWPWSDFTQSEIGGVTITDYYFGWMCFQFCLTTVKEQP